MCGRGKKSAGPQALGRSRGGFSTKLHATCDSHGNPLRFILTPGQASDHTQAHALLADFQIKEAVLADKGYDSDALAKTITETGADCVIPPTKKRKQQREYDVHLYKERNQVERLFNKLKNFRRVATRYDKLDVAFLSFIHLAAIYLWLK